MAALDFPSSPTPGEVYSGYTWDGEKWIRQATTGTVQKPDTAQYLTASGTYITPSGCTSIDVEWIGGGAGGAGSGTSPGAGGPGLPSTFGPFGGVNAGGGANASGGGGGVATGGYLNKTGTIGGNASGLTNSIGGVGGSGPFGGGGAGGAAGGGIGMPGAANSGGGGGGGGVSTTINGGGGGGSGGYGRGVIVNPAASYAYTIGAGGAAGAGGTGGLAAGAGGTGCIIVTEHYDTVVGVEVSTAKKNYIVNGAMMVSQENGTAAGTVAGYYSVDQFFLGFINGGTNTIAQVAVNTPSGSPNRIRYTATVADAAVAAGDYAAIGTKLEGLRVTDLMSGTANAKTITIRFGCKGPAGTYHVGIENGAQNRSYVVPFTISAGEANTDVVKTVTLRLDDTGTWLRDNGIGMVLFWTLMSGTTFHGTTNAWQAGNFFSSATQFNFMGTAGNVFELFDVGLYEGEVAPPFVVPDYPSELLLCMRYYYKTDIVVGGYNVGSISNAFSSGAYIGATYSYHTKMRINPAAAIFGSWTTTNCATPVFWTGSPHTYSLYAVAAAAGNVVYYGGGVTANARL